MKRSNTTISGLFEHLHNNPPAPFNPKYIEWSKDVSTITTANCIENGVYDITNRLTRAVLWRDEYERVMSLGKPQTVDVLHAKTVVYEMG